MKIVLVNKFLYKRGGSETYYLALADALEKSGHTVYFFGMRDEHNTPRPEEKYYIDNIDYEKEVSTIDQIRQGIKSIYSFEAKRKFEALIKEYKPDIVHLNLVHRQITLSILDVCKRYSIPVVFTTHDLVCACPVGSLLTPERKTCRACYGGKYINCVKNNCIKGSKAKSLVAFVEENFYRLRGSYNLISAYITPSAFHKNEIIKSGITKMPIHHITNFLPWGTEYKTYPGKKYFLFLGSLTKDKGVMTIVKGFHKSGIKDYQLLLAGTGPEEQALKEYIGANSLGDNIKLLGFVSGNALATLTQEAYTVIMASECYENCPYGLMEPMACGKPVIGAEIGGIPELAIEGVTGWTFESGNSDDLASAMQKAVSLSPEEYARLSKSTCEFAKEHFLVDNYITKLTNLYSDLLEK